MSIKQQVNEINTLNLEIKRNNMRNKQLRTRVKQLEHEIMSYLKSKDQSGVKYNGQAIILEQTEKRPPKKKKDREQDIVEWLRNMGISDPDHAFAQLQNIQRGEPQEVNKLKFKKLPNF